MTLKDIIIAGKLTISEGGGGGGEDWRKKDGKTYLHITIDQNVFKTVNLRFGQTVASGNTINWGDGSAAVTPTNTSSAYVSHTFLHFSFSFLYLIMSRMIRFETIL